MKVFVFGDSQIIVDSFDDTESPIDTQTLKDIQIFVKEELNCEKHKERMRHKYRPMGVKKAMKLESAEFSKSIAQNSSQFSKGVKNITHDYEGMIRLSVHPHDNIDEKCGIGLVYGSMGTPWHMSPILGLGDNGIALMKKGEFIKKYYKGRAPLPQMCAINGVILPYYQWGAEM